MMKSNKTFLNLFFDKLIKIMQINLFLTIGHHRKLNFQNKFKILSEELNKYKWKLMN
jgi:hypothetical protein